VGTGEGKSLIIGMLAAFVAKKGMRAHVVNNNRVLSQRDFAANDRLFAMLGIRASADPAQLKQKEMQVVYCTSDDVEGSCFDCLIEGEIEEYEESLKDAILIVDEVDGLIFDKGATSSRFFEDRDFSDSVNDWLTQLRQKGSIARAWDDFRSQDECSRALQKEVEEAFKASSTKKEGRDYTKRGGEIYMLDKKTNMINEQSWSLWLEILKSQNNYPEKWVEYKYEKAILSRLQCFMSYSCIFGLTGSLGQQAEKNYLLEHYEAVTFNVPFFLDTCRAEGAKGVQGKRALQQVGQREPLPGPGEQEDAVLELAAQKCAEVPVLIVVKDSAAVVRLANRLPKKLGELYDQSYDTGDTGATIRLLHNPKKPGEFVELVDRSTEALDGHGENAGDIGRARQAWRITLTTAEGGRGHDYRVVDPAIDKAGGLLLILTWVPWSEREWIQFLGRTGRQDHAGQYAVLLDAQDDVVKAAGKKRRADESFAEAILRHGDAETAQLLQATKETIAKGKLMHRLSSRYWSLHKQDKTSKKQNWEWKKVCEDYLTISVHDIEQRFLEYFPTEASAEGILKRRIPKQTAEPMQASAGDRRGQSYQGQEVNGKPHGHGLCTTADGATYEGQWDQGLRHGLGKYTDASGAIYEGEWRSNHKSGKGEESYPDGARYEGDFHQSCKHGTGKYVTVSGGIYKGQFRRDKMDGYGCYECASGRKYAGQWRLGQKHGKGKTIWADGVSHEGFYESDVRHGQGTVTWPDGRVYRGTWNKSRLDGPGVMVTASEVQAAAAAAEAAAAAASAEAAACSGRSGPVSPKSGGPSGSGLTSSVGDILQALDPSTPSNIVRAGPRPRPPSAQERLINGEKLKL